MEHYSERRPATCPQESFVFPTCSGGARPLPDTPNQTVERDWRQAMPRAEPTLSRALLHLSAVAGAAITTAITTPVTPSGPPPRTADTGRVSCPQGLCRDNHRPATPGKAQGLTWCYYTLTAATLARLSLWDSASADAPLTPCPARCRWRFASTMPSGTSWAC